MWSVQIDYDCTEKKKKTEMFVEADILCAKFYYKLQNFAIVSSRTCQTADAEYRFGYSSIVNGLHTNPDPPRRV